MRLKNYLNEGIQDKLIGQAQPFFDEFGDQYRQGNFIWRGKTGVEGVELKKARKNRKPRIVNQKLHKILSEFTTDLFGWDARSEGVFTGGRLTASPYGQPCIFVPKGNYQYVWVENPEELVYPLYDEITEWLNRDDYPESEVEKLLDKLKDVYRKNYKTSGLSEILGEPRYEAIFRCEEYFLITSSYWEEHNLSSMI